jgi:hypothetical protein
MITIPKRSNLMVMTPVWITQVNMQIGQSAIQADKLSIHSTTNFKGPADRVRELIASEN